MKYNGTSTYEKIHYTKKGARGVMVIVAGIGHGDTSSNPGLVAFHIALIPLGKVWIQLFSLQLWVNSMGQIELNCELIQNGITWKRTVVTFKLRTYTKLNCLK